MKTDVWKVSVNLRRKRGPVVTVFARTPSGRVISTGGLITDERPVSLVVGQAFESFDEFDDEAFKRVHVLATQAARAQQDEQADSEEK